MTINVVCCHIRHLNLLKIYPGRTANLDKAWFMILILKVLNFLSLKKIIEKLNRKIIFALMYLAMKIILFILIKYQIKSFKIICIYCWYHVKTSHTMCILKILTDLCIIRQNVGPKNIFYRYCLQCFSNE